MDGDDGLDFDLGGGDDTAGLGCMVASLLVLTAMLVALVFYLAFGEGPSNGQ